MFIEWGHQTMGLVFQCRTFLTNDCGKLFVCFFCALVYLHFLISGFKRLDYFPFHISDNPSRWLSYFSEGWLNHQPVLTMLEGYDSHLFHNLSCTALSTCNRWMLDAGSHRCSKSNPHFLRVQWCSMGVKCESLMFKSNSFKAPWPP